MENKGAKGLFGFSEKQSIDYEQSTDFKDYFIKRLATLCDDSPGLTCSADVAKRAGIAKEVVHCISFEAACEAVKRGEADALLVPGAYPRLNAFIMDADLDAFYVFIMRIPGLVLAVPPGQEDTDFQILYHHPAVTPLLSEIKVSWRDAQHVVSNVQACRLVIDSKRPAVCITNTLCADYYHLHTLAELRTGILMPWICFEKHSVIAKDAPSLDTAHAV